MPARLIVNADDFGLTAGINRAIAELHTAGVLTSATLMANGPAFDDAVAIARALPTLGVGCHIVLADGVPLAPPEHIPGLLGPDRLSLRPLSSFVQALYRGTIQPAEIELEALLQIHKLQRAGIRITHLDTHKHTHIFPAVARRLLPIASSNGITAIRNPFEPAFSLRLHHGPTLRQITVRAANLFRPAFQSLLAEHPAIHTTSGTLAIAATGDLHSSTLAGLLRALPPHGRYELCCHPGYNDAALKGVRTRLRAERNTEREALLTEIPRALAQPAGPELTHYANL